MTTSLGPDSIQLKMEDQGPFSKLKKKIDYRRYSGYVHARTYALIYLIEDKKKGNI